MINSFELDSQNFEKQINQTLLNEHNEIVYYQDYPLYINSKKQLRIPFYTFDRFTDLLLDPNLHEIAPMCYETHILSRENIEQCLDDLGIEYNYVLGERLDFFMEKEMKQSAINKVFQRELLGPVYFEKSSHDTVSTQKPKAATCAMMTLNDYPIMVLTVQDENDEIIEQFNTYILGELDEQKMAQISDKFLSLGDSDTVYLNVEEVSDFQYCQEHLKLNGCVIHID